MTDCNSLRRGTRKMLELVDFLIRLISSINYVKNKQVPVCIDLDANSMISVSVENG